MKWDPLEALSDAQIRRLRDYAALLVEINQHINLISREDEEDVFARHVRHALTLTYRAFPGDCTIVDWGTGGGLPAVPLAIAFPDARVVGVDAAGKKVRAVRTMARRLGLDNLEVWHGRANAFPGRATYSVSRATAPLADLWRWHRRIFEDPGVRQASDHAETPNVWRPGLVCLKGGELSEERRALLALERGIHIDEYSISGLTGEADRFEDKVILACYLDAASPSAYR